MSLSISEVLRQSGEIPLGVSDPKLVAMREQVIRASQHEGGAGADFAGIHPIGSDSAVAITRLLDTLRENNPNANFPLVQAVAQLVAKLKPARPDYFVGGKFTPTDELEYGCMPIYAAADIARRKFDVHTMSGANTIIAQLTHNRLADRTLSPDVLRGVLLDYIAPTGKGISRDELDHVEQIMILSQECARIDRHPYDNEDIYGAGRDLIELLDTMKVMKREGLKNTPDYNSIKASYEEQKDKYTKARTRNSNIFAGDESYFLNADFPDRTLFVRMRDTIDKLQWLLTKNRREGGAGPRAEKRAVQMAQYVAGTYMPMFERMGWGESREGLGFLIMQVLDRNAEAGITQRISALPHEVYVLARKQIKAIADTDTVLKDYKEKYGITFELYEREKSIYSIWEKMFRKSLEKDRIYDFEEGLQDLVGMRFVFEKTQKGSQEGDLSAADFDRLEKEAALRLHKAIKDHVAANPLGENRAGTTGYRIPEGKDKDYITIPKDNGYESTHLTVEHRHAGQPVPAYLDIQIRTRRMDDYEKFSEEAFHGIYKDPGHEETAAMKLMREARDVGRQLTGRMRDVVRVMEHRREMRRRMLELANVHMDGEKAYYALSRESDHVTVRTRDGKSFDLPRSINRKSATLLDHLYLIVVGLGASKQYLFDRMTGVKINDEIVDLSPAALAKSTGVLTSRLQNADKVEILYESNEGFSVTQNPWFQHLKRGWDRGVLNPADFVNVDRLRPKLGLAKAPKDTPEPGPRKRGRHVRADGPDESMPPPSPSGAR